MVHTLQSMNNLTMKKRSKEQFQNTFSDEFYKDYPDANTTEIKKAFDNNIDWGRGKLLGRTPTEILQIKNLPDAIRGFKEREDAILKAKLAPPPPPPAPVAVAPVAPVAAAPVASPAPPVLPVGKKAPPPPPPQGKQQGKLPPVPPQGKLPPAPPQVEPETDKVYKDINFQKLTQHQNLKPKVVEKQIKEQITESDLITALKRQQKRLLKMGTGAKLRYNYAWGKTQNVKNLI